MSETVNKMSYNPNDAPPPVNNHDWYVKAVLVELRLIRMALEKLSTPPVVPQASSGKK